MWWLTDSKIWHKIDNGFSWRDGAHPTYYILLTVLSLNRNEILFGLWIIAKNYFFVSWYLAYTQRSCKKPTAYLISFLYTWKSHSCTIDCWRKRVIPPSCELTRLVETSQTPRGENTSLFYYIKFLAALMWIVNKYVYVFFSLGVIPR